MQETAVEWLYNYLFPEQLDGFSNEEWSKIDSAFKQAKEIENKNSYTEEEVYSLLHNLMSSVSLGLLKINDDMDLKAWFNKNKK